MTEQTVCLRCAESSDATLDRCPACGKKRSPLRVESAPVPQPVALRMFDVPGDPDLAIREVPVKAHTRHVRRRMPGDDHVSVGAAHPETAQAMKQRALPRSGTFRAAMLLRLLEMADYGQTDYELEAHFGRSHQSTSGCRNGLVADGWAQAHMLDGVAHTRTNGYGNEATVWVATADARTWMERALR